MAKQEIEIPRKQQIINYFTIEEAHQPSWKTRLFRTGITLILVGMFISLYFKNSLVVGVPCIVVGSYLMARWYRPYLRDKKLFLSRPNDEQIDNWLLEDLNVIIKKKSIDKLKLDESVLNPENFIMVPYPVFWKSSVGEPKRREGADGKYRYSVWNVQILVLSKDYISYYICTFDFISGNITTEFTNEFFYSDIVSVKSDSDALGHNLWGEENKPVGNIPIMKLSILSGDAFTIVTSIPQFKSSGKLIVNLDKVVQTLRIIIRKSRLDLYENENLTK